jgi:predicted NBD/HSP70 family sugar kinase
MDPYCNSRVLAASGDGSVTAFFDRLRSGDADAADAWDSYTTDLAVVIHNVRVMFGSRIILGGDVGAKCGPDLGPLWDKVDELSFLPSDSRSFLRACTVTEYPIALGSALYVVDQFRNDPDRFALPRSRARGA